MGRCSRCHLRSGLCLLVHLSINEFLGVVHADRQHDERGVMLMLDVEDRHAYNETPSSASTVAPRRCRPLVLFLLLGALFPSILLRSSRADPLCFAFPRSNFVRVLGVTRCSWLQRAPLACPSLHALAESQCLVLLGVWSRVRGVRSADILCGQALSLDLLRQGFGWHTLACRLYDVSALRQHCVPRLVVPFERRTSRARDDLLVHDVLRGNLTSEADNAWWYG